MNYNSVISVKDISDDSGTITEPVTLDEMKDYMRLRGFVNVGDSPPTDIGNFSFDDTLITENIKAARQMLEETAGISIIFHTWEAVVTNLCGRIEIPYGPIIGIWYVKDVDGNALSYTTEGNLWLYLVTPQQRNLIITYDAGYGSIKTELMPKGIKLDVMRLTYYLYENRGNDPAIAEYSSRLASKYSRKCPIA